MEYMSMGAEQLAKAEEVLREFPGIASFFGQWLSGQFQRAGQGFPHHVLLDFLDSPYGRTIAEKLDKAFEVATAQIPDQCPRLRKKLIDADQQAEFESVLFELEIATQLLGHGYPLEVEPLRAKQQKSPDFRTVLVGYPTYIEAKKLQADADVALAWDASRVVEQRLRAIEFPAPVDISFSVSPGLHTRYQGGFVKQILDAAGDLAQGGIKERRIVFSDGQGNEIGHAAIKRSPSEASSVVGGVWSRSQSQMDLWERERNLADRYFTGEQFPDDGVKVLIVDTSKLIRGELLLSSAWVEAAGDVINGLVLCSRQNRWGRQITDGARVLDNRQVPMPPPVFQALTDAFVTTALDEEGADD
jgi:hypothetical protein